MAEKYIKVTPKGSDQSFVILEANKLFYLSHGAKVEPVEEPTAAADQPTEKRKRAKRKTTNS